MSPEQWLGVGVGKASDIYSFNILFFELLTGRLPFEATTYEGWRNLHFDCNPPAPGQIRQGIGSDLDYLMLSCLHKDPFKRPTSFFYIRETLEELYGKP